jgi:hypothetical protein
VRVKVVYQLLRVEEFPTKTIQLALDHDADNQGTETKPYHVLNGPRPAAEWQLSVLVGHWALTGNCITHVLIYHIQP